MNLGRLNPFGHGHRHDAQGNEPDLEAGASAEAPDGDAGDAEEEDDEVANAESSAADTVAPVELDAGSYTLRVHVHEGKNYVSGTGGDIRALVEVRVLNVGEAGAVQRTRVKVSSSAGMFNEEFVFQLRSTAEEMNGAVLSVSLFDVPLVRQVGSRLVGTWEMELNLLYAHTDHEVFKQWVGLELLSEGVGVQGMLMLSAMLLASGDRPRIHSPEEEGEPNALRLASVRRTPWAVCVRAHWAEGLPNADTFSKSDPYVELRRGSDFVRTSIVVDSLDPVWEQQVELPYFEPVAVDDVAVRLMDEDAMASDDILGVHTLSLHDLPEGTREPPPGVEPRWVHFYGANPGGLGTRLADVAKRVNEGRLRGGHYRGRLLLTAWRRQIRADAIRPRSDNLPLESGARSRRRSQGGRAVASGAATAAGGVGRGAASGDGTGGGSAQGLGGGLRGLGTYLSTRLKAPHRRGLRVPRRLRRSHERAHQAVPPDRRVYELRCWLAEASELGNGGAAHWSVEVQWAEESITFDAKAPKDGMAAWFDKKRLSVRLPEDVAQLPDVCLYLRRHPRGVGGLFAHLPGGAGGRGQRVGWQRFPAVDLLQRSLSTAAPPPAGGVGHRPVPPPPGDLPRRGIALEWYLLEEDPVEDAFGDELPGYVQVSLEVLTRGEAEARPFADLEQPVLVPKLLVARVYRARELPPPPPSFGARVGLALGGGDEVDPFVVFRCRDARLQTRRVRKSASPMWFEERRTIVRLPAEESLAPLIFLSVLDRGLGGLRNTSLAVQAIGCQDVHATSREDLDAARPTFVRMCTPDGRMLPKETGVLLSLGLWAVREDEIDAALQLPGPSPAPAPGAARGAEGGGGGGGAGEIVDGGVGGGGVSVGGVVGGGVGVGRSLNVPSRACRIELIVIGCRGLSPVGAFAAPRSPLVEIDLGSSASRDRTDPATRKHANPSYFDVLVIRARLPVDPWLCPVLNIRAKSSVLLGGVTSLIGAVYQPLDHLLPWTEVDAGAASGAAAGGNRGEGAGVDEVGEAATDTAAVEGEPDEDAPLSPGFSEDVTASPEVASPERAARTYGCRLTAAEIEMHAEALSSHNEWAFPRPSRVGSVDPASGNTRGTAGAAQKSARVASALALDLAGGCSISVADPLTVSRAAMNFKHLRSGEDGGRHAAAPGNDGAGTYPAGGIGVEGALAGEDGGGGTPVDAAGRAADGTAVVRDFAAACQRESRRSAAAPAASDQPGSLRQRVRSLEKRSARLFGTPASRSRELERQERDEKGDVVGFGSSGDYPESKMDLNADYLKGRVRLKRELEKELSRDPLFDEWRLEAFTTHGIPGAHGTDRVEVGKVKGLLRVVTDTDDAEGASGGDTGEDSASDDGHGQGGHLAARAGPARGGFLSPLRGVLRPTRMSRGDHPATGDADTDADTDTEREAQGLLGAAAAGGGTAPGPDGGDTPVGDSGAAEAVGGIVRREALLTLAEPQTERIWRVVEHLKRAFAERTLVVRVYVLRAKGLLPASSSGGLMGVGRESADPFVVARLGRHSAGSSLHHVRGKLNPKFFQCFELQAELPGDGLLNVEVYDWSLFSTGAYELMGRTEIDIENRLMNADWLRSDPKPLEWRRLSHPLITDDQWRGRVQLWVDVLDPAAAKRTPPIDISPAPKAPLQVRVIVWQTKGIANLDWNQSDQYVRVRLEGCDPLKRPQELTTDVHYAARCGRAEFNYRMTFDVQVPVENGAPLYVEVLDYDWSSRDDLGGSAKIRLASMLHYAYSHYQEMEDARRVLSFPFDDSTKALFDEQPTPPASPGAARTRRASGTSSTTDGRSLDDVAGSATDDAADGDNQGARRETDAWQQKRFWLRLQPPRNTSRGQRALRKRPGGTSDADPFVQLSIHVLSPEGVAKYPAGRLKRESPNLNPYLEEPTRPPSLKVFFLGCEALWDEVNAHVPLERILCVLCCCSTCSGAVFLLIHYGLLLYTTARDIEDDLTA